MDGFRASPRLARFGILPLILALFCSALAALDSPEIERQISLSELGAEPRTLAPDTAESANFTWWLPPGADAYVLPISGGVVVDADAAARSTWLRGGSPWSLTRLPVLGVRYGDQTLVVIVPWPHYASIVFPTLTAVESDARVGVRFSFPEDRLLATPRAIVAQLAGAAPLEVARVFREWRASTENRGAIPGPRSLAEKARDLPKVARLFGAPHIYLWGPAHFSRHDVPRGSWIALARKLRDAAAESPEGRLRERFWPEQRKSLEELAASERAATPWMNEVAGAINGALSLDRASGASSQTALANPKALAELAERRRDIEAALGGIANDPKTWGDGFSISLLDELHAAGIDRAVLILSDLYSRALRPDVVARAEELGYLIGPYDSYHSVHAPDAAPDETWETAQFDREAFESGRVLTREGKGSGGFKGRGFHFSPLASRPYMERRVTAILREQPYSTWFIDCDATAECFDDYHPLHSATRVDDIAARRDRLRWLELDRRLVVGSEDGSALFADVIHFGHGVETPYIGHLDASFRDRESPHFLGRYWPSDTPDVSFRPSLVPPALISPYFDPGVRIPLYRAALGDDVIVSHHWSFDSLKFSDVAKTRELLEILYMVPPLVHLNRETWPQRKERVVAWLSFWSRLHRELATAPLTRFEWLSADRKLQRTIFRHAAGAVEITVNFAAEPIDGFLPGSATAEGGFLDEKISYAAR
jgi:hypothetical protein